MSKNNEPKVVRTRLKTHHYKTVEGEYVVFTCRLDKPLADAFVAYSQKHERPMSNMIRYLIKKAIESDE